MDSPQALTDLIFVNMVIALTGFIVTSAATAAVGYFVGKMRNHKEDKEQQEKIDKARITIEKATARRLIFEAHKDYVEDSKPLTIDRFREITETFDAYSVLGGNGTAKKFYEEISAVPIVMIN